MMSDLPLGVAEDHSLCDGEGVVQITQSVKLPLLPLHCHEELLYSLQGQLITGGKVSLNRIMLLNTFSQYFLEDCRLTA